MPETTIRIDRLRLSAPGLDHDTARIVAEGLGPAIGRRLADVVSDAGPGRMTITRLAPRAISDDRRDGRSIGASVADAVARDLARRLPDRGRVR
jgi:hypothetical protein